MKSGWGTEVAVLSYQLLFAPLIKRWERYSPLSDDDKQAVLALSCQPRSFGRDAYLVRDGEPAVNCHLLLTGHGFRQKLVKSGARQIISIHLPGEFVDLQNLFFDVGDHNVQCCNRSDVAVIPKAALIQIAAERPSVARAMWLDTLIDASISREWVVNVGRRDAKTRIAHLLCELVTRARNAGQTRNDSCEFPMTQEQIADATGLTPVHTNRTLQTLRRDGLISLSSSKLTVLDWERLSEHGDFSERYLHHAG